MQQSDQGLNAPMQGVATAAMLSLLLWAVLGGLIYALLL